MVKFSPTFLAIMSALLTTGSASPYHVYNTSAYCLPHRGVDAQQRNLFSKFVNEFYVVRNVSRAFHTYITEDYIQHNPSEGQGAEASITYLTPIFQDSAIGVEVLRTGYDNGLGWIHTKITGYAPLPVAIIDVFRYNGSCIQEHWDVIEELPANSTNPIALF